MDGVELKTSLGFYEIPSTERNIQAPPPKQNGGLYTGKPAPAGAGWAAVPITPESHIYLAPALAPTHIPGGNRAGNNTTQFPQHAFYDQSTYAYIQCAQASGAPSVPPVPRDPLWISAGLWA